MDRTNLSWLVRSLRLCIYESIRVIFHRFCDILFGKGGEQDGLIYSKRNLRHVILQIDIRKKFKADFFAGNAVTKYIRGYREISCELY